MLINYVMATLYVFDISEKRNVSSVKSYPLCVVQGNDCRHMLHVALTRIDGLQGCCSNGSFMTSRLSEAFDPRLVSLSNLESLMVVGGLGASNSGRLSLGLFKLEHLTIVMAAPGAARFDKNFEFAFTEYIFSLTRISLSIGYLTAMLAVT